MKNKMLFRQTLIYLPLPVVLIVAVSLLQWVDVSMADLFYYCALLLVAATGVLHVMLMKRFFYQETAIQVGFGLLLTLLIMLIAGMIIFIIDRVTDQDIQFLTFIIPFLIPFVCWHTYRYFLKIN